MSLYLLSPLSRVIKPVAVLGSLSVALTGCSTMQGAVDYTTDIVKENKGAVTGFVVGSLAAGAACALNGSDNVTGCVVGGAIAGGVAGYLWDQREKALNAAARKHNLDLETERLKTQNDRYLTDFGQAAQGVSDSENAMSAVIKDTGMFAAGSSRLNKSSRAALLDITRSYTGSNEKVLIIGHTDSSGSARLNQQLSERRARAVAQLFIDTGIPQENIYYLGAGESRPIVSNATVEGRMQNRRVEIVAADSEASIVAYNIAETRSKDNILFSNKDTSQQTSPVGSTRALIDFGGDRVADADLGFYNAVVAASPSDFSFSLFSKAHADTPGSITPVACYEDAPRISGAIRKAGDGEQLDSKKYKIKEHVPGLASNAIKAMVNGHNVGLGPVAVLRNSLDVPQEPTLFLSRDDDGRGGKADLKYKTVVNTYEGKDNFLYRVFVIDVNPAVQCIDLLYPKEGGSKAVAGALFYNADGVYAASFQPTRF